MDWLTIIVIALIGALIGAPVLFIIFVFFQDGLELEFDIFQFFSSVWEQFSRQGEGGHGRMPRNNVMPFLMVRLISFLFPSEEERENFVGDLLEEYLQIDSRLRARVWIYKQVLASIPPLLIRYVKRSISAKLRTPR